VREEGEDISPSNHPHQNKKKKKETTNKREKQQGFQKDIYIYGGRSLSSWRCFKENYACSFCLLEASDRGHRTLVWLVDQSGTKFGRIAAASLLADTRGLTDVTVPDEGDRASTVEVDSFDSTKANEVGSEGLEIETLLLGFNTINNDKDKTTSLIPADGKTRSKELDEALGNVLLLSGGIEIALAIANEPSTTLNELPEIGALDDTLVDITGDELAVVGDTKEGTKTGASVDDVAITDDRANAGVIGHAKETGVGGELAAVLLGGGGSGSNTRALVIGSVGVISIGNTLHNKSMASDSLTNKRFLQNLVSNNFKVPTSRSSKIIITDKIAFRGISTCIASTDRLNRTEFERLYSCTSKNNKTS